MFYIGKFMLSIVINFPQISYNECHGKILGGPAMLSLYISIAHVRWFGFQGRISYARKDITIRIFRREAYPLILPSGKTQVATPDLTLYIDKGFLELMGVRLFKD